MVLLASEFFELAVKFAIFDVLNIEQAVVGRRLAISLFIFKLIKNLVEGIFLGLLSSSFLVFLLMFLMNVKNLEHVLVVCELLVCALSLDLPLIHDDYLVC